jgi:hypothetical protein
MPNRVVLLHSDVLVNRGSLAAALPDAWAYVLTTQHGGSADVWKHAYERIADDWESYWADLDVSGDDSVNQWREGRWRVVRGWFRLAGEEPPPNDQMEYFLDGLMELVGAQTVRFVSDVWRDRAVDMLDKLANAGQTVAIVDPYAPAALLRGMLVACRSVVHRGVIGPDELGQVGLEGLEWNFLAQLAEGDPATMQFVSPHWMRGANLIDPPANLTDLIPLLTEDGHVPH